jgi:hypothetical protein
MKRSIPVLLALTIGCATGAAVRDIVAPARAQGQAGPNYEYDVVQVIDGDNASRRKEVLSKYSREGWRLVGVTTERGNHSLYFERQLPK